MATTCPLGHTCREIIDGDEKRCSWYVKLQGTHPQTGEALDRWDCAIAWMPVLSVELAKNNVGISSAIESFRNEMVQGQQAFNSLALQSNKQLGG